VHQSEFAGKSFFPQSAGNARPGKMRDLVGQAFQPDLAAHVRQGLWSQPGKADLQLLPKPCLPQFTPVSSFRAPCFRVQ